MTVPRRCPKGETLLASAAGAQLLKLGLTKDQVARLAEIAPIIGHIANAKKPTMSSQRAALKELCESLTRVEEAMAPFRNLADKRGLGLVLRTKLDSAMDGSPRDWREGLEAFDEQALELLIHAQHALRKLSEKQVRQHAPARAVQLIHAEVPTLNLTSDAFGDVLSFVGVTANLDRDYSWDRAIREVFNDSRSRKT